MNGKNNIVNNYNKYTINYNQNFKLQKYQNI